MPSADEPGMSYEDALHNLTAVNYCRESWRCRRTRRSSRMAGTRRGFRTGGQDWVVEEFSESDIIKHAENNGSRAGAAGDRPPRG